MKHWIKRRAETVLPMGGLLWMGCVAGGLVTLSVLLGAATPTASRLPRQQERRALPAEMPARAAWARAGAATEAVPTATGTVAGSPGSPGAGALTDALPPPSTPGAGIPSPSLEVSPNPAGPALPTITWDVRTPQDVDMDPELLQQAIDYAFTTIGADEERLGARTDGLVIVRQGALVYERYARGYRADMRHLAWSVTKSFVNALYGIAVRDGLLKVEDPAYLYYPPLDTPDRRGITIDHLLHMSSGLYWSEGYEASPLNSSVIGMLYTLGREDMAAFAATRPLAYPHGAHWYYSSGTTNILMGILRARLGDEVYAAYPWDQLFDPLGMSSAVLERDQAGTFVGSSYLYATPRDLAKFGLLFLNDGRWGENQLLPAGWVDYSRTMARSYYTTELTPEDKEDNPGAHWWLNVGIPERGQAPPWPDAPPDTFAALGHWGQSIFVIPSLDLVVVRTADDRDGSFSKNTLLKLIASSVRTR